MGGLKLALILVLFTFGVWNEMAYVAGEWVGLVELAIERIVVAGSQVIHLGVGIKLLTVYNRFVTGELPGGGLPPNIMP